MNVPIFTSTDSYEVTLVIERIGSYGTLSVLWEDGYAIGEVPEGFFEGIVSPVTGAITMSHGQDRAILPIGVSILTIAFLGLTCLF